MSEKSEMGLAEAVIEKGNIVIRVAISALPTAWESAIDAGWVEPGFGIVNAKKFAKDLVNALNEEGEDGTTRIHRLFDEACEYAIEQGADGVEEVSEEEP